MPPKSIARPCRSFKMIFLAIAVQPDAWSRRAGHTSSVLCKGKAFSAFARAPMSCVVCMSAPTPAEITKKAQNTSLTVLHTNFISLKRLCPNWTTECDASAYLKGASTSERTEMLLSVTSLHRLLLPETKFSCNEDEHVQSRALVRLQLRLLPCLGFYSSHFAPPRLAQWPPVS